jgi:hypothetical protein
MQPHTHESSAEASLYDHILQDAVSRFWAIGDPPPPLIERPTFHISIEAALEDSVRDPTQAVQLIGELVTRTDKVPNLFFNDGPSNLGSWTQLGRRLGYWVIVDLTPDELPAIWAESDHRAEAKYGPRDEAEG